MAVSRAEQILTSMINGTPYAEYPQSRLEDLLLQLKAVIEQGGGGTPTASDVSYDNTTSGMTADDVQDAIDEVFQSVSSGKTLIAGAITDKGVQTSASDSFSTMATNIAAIPTGGGVEVLENFKGTFLLPSSGNWKPHTMTKAGYITAMFICTWSGQTVQVRKGTTNITTIAINAGTTQALGANRVPVVAGDVIQIWKSADANGACEYLLIFEEE